MTTLGTLVKGHGLTVAPLPFDLESVVRHLEATAFRLVASLGGPQLDPTTIRASVIGFINQDDDAHEPCSLTACRAPLHPGPCKGWKGTLAKVAPGTYKQLETERVAKANARRLKKIQDLKAQGKPIPRRLLTEIKAKPDPNAGVGGATATPLSKVNQQADLAGGQAHTTSQAINQAAGIKPNLPLGPKQKKPTVAGRGPAFVITQPKVTDHYKLGKAEALTAADWAALSPADKKLIRDELEAIKVRGFGPQQARADALLAKLPAASTLGTSATPNAPAAPQAPSAAPGRTTLGKATKTLPRPNSSGTTPAADPNADAAKKAASGTASTADVLDAAKKVDPATLDDAQKKAIRDRLDFIANHPKATPQQKKDAAAARARIAAPGGTAPAGATAPAAPAVSASKPTLPSPGPSPAPAAKPSLPTATGTPGPAASTAQGATSLAITEAIFGPQVTDPAKVADMFDKMKASGGDIRDNRNFKLLVDRLANAALKKASASKMPGLGHGANDIGITEFNHQIRDHIADGKPGLPPVVAKLKAHLDAQKSGGSPSAPAGPAAPQPNAPTVAKSTPTSAPSGATPAPVAASKPTLPSPGPSPAPVATPSLPSPSAGPTPQAPGAPNNTPKAFPPHVQTARATAGRAVGTRATSKNHLETYGKLSKADFDSLDQATQRTIRDDLANASAKFLDPAKKQAARDLLARFGSRHTSPAPGAPNVPANPKGYSDPQQQAVKAATSGTIVTDDVLKSVARLTPDQVTKLDGPDKQAILNRLAFIATHPKATDEQKAQAAAYGRIINGGSLVPAGKNWDHAPSIGELAREEKTGGHAAIADAVAAARNSTLSKDDKLKALSALTKAQFDTLSDQDKRQVIAALQDLFYKSGTGGSLDPAAEKAITKYTGMHPAIYRMTQVEADFKAGRATGEDVHRAFITARVEANPTLYKAASDELEKLGADVARRNPGLPMWARSEMVGRPKYGTSVYDAITMAGGRFNWEPAPRMSSGDFQKLYRGTDADLNAVDPLHAQAVRELRARVITTGLEFSSPWSTATKDQAINAFLGVGGGRAGGGPEVDPQRLPEFKKLPGAVQTAIVSHLKARLRTQTNNNAKTETYITLRELEGLPPLTGTYRNAMLEATEGYAAASKQDVYRQLDPIDFQSMPTYTRDAISEHLDKFHATAARRGAVHRWQQTDNALKVLPKALAAHLAGERPGAGLARDERNAADFSLYGTGIIAPEDRVAAYNKLTAGQLARLDPQVTQAVRDDLDKIENDSALPIQTRYDAAMNRQIFLRINAAITLNPDQISAAQAADLNPRSKYSDAAALTAFHSLSKADYDSMSPALREAIDARLAVMPGPAQQIITAKFHPPATPTATPAVANLPSGTVPTGATTAVSPRVQTALDVIYGTNPKAHTMAAQLSAYGGLTGGDFNAFNVQEQQQLLSDLSFIATTAKGPSADKARKLIDRFTPPGTPSGQLPPNPAVVPPANSVPGQVRYATPQVGTLVMAKDKGKGGDGWVTTPGGKRVWGKYGAAGLLLRHVDPNTGEKRYLMVQRGPAISDPGKWQFPGGAIDEKETFHQGGAREVIEELGFKPDDLKSAGVVGEHTSSIPGSSWKYVSIAADVPAMLKPDLSSHHAQMETSDAKWMTEAEIRALDTSGKLLAPLAGGKLEQNVMSLFPAGATSGTGKLGQVARPGPVTKRPKRMTLPPGGRQTPANFNAWPHAHKPSTGKNLVADKQAIKDMRQKVKQERGKYDGKTADGRLAAIGAMQGFDAMPTVLDKKEIDRLLATGDYIEAWRGVSGAGGGWSARSRGGSGGKTAAQINEEMRSGPAYYGKGIFGNGYYLATRRDVAVQYSDRTPGSLVRILIPKSAVMEKYTAVEREAQANSSRTSKSTGPHVPGDDGLSTFWDPGRWGAAKGLDGIEITPNMRAHRGGGSNHVAFPGKPAFNWLNRSVLILQKEPG